MTFDKQSNPSPSEGTPLKNQKEAMEKYLQDKSLESDNVSEPCNTCDEITKAVPNKGPLSV